VGKMENFTAHEIILHLILELEFEKELNYLQSFNGNKMDDVIKSYKGEKTERQILEKSFFANFEFDKFVKELSIRLIEVIVNYTDRISKDEKYFMDFFKIFSSFISSKIAKNIIIAIENVNSYSTNPNTDDSKYIFFEKDNFAKRVKSFNTELFSEHYKPYSKTKNIFDPQLQYKKSDPSIDNFIEEILLDSEMLMSLFTQDIKRATELLVKINNRKLKIEKELASFRNKKGKEWREALYKLAKQIYEEKRYTDKTKALKEAFEQMDSKFQDLYRDEYSENEQAIIRTFQRRF